MSKDNSNLRLLGSPVNLSYRNKKKDDKKNIRNRPRSALQNSCFTADNQERYKRPFSADAKEASQSTKSLFETLSTDLVQCYNNSPITTVKIVPPTTDILGDTKSNTNKFVTKDREICSNASDYGSEDTFISLGTQIKTRAQLGPKIKNVNCKNALKYRNIAKRGRKPIDNNEDNTILNEYGLEIKISERAQRPQSPSRNKDIIYYQRSVSPSFKTRAFESYFIPLEPNIKGDEEALAGRVSFGSSDIQEDVEQAIDTYSRRLTLTKQQLSLVEEESTQDVDSGPSQHMSSLSAENSLDEPKKVIQNPDGNLIGMDNYIANKEDDYRKTPNFMTEPRTYTSFYDDFRANSLDPYRTKITGTAILTDASSKDSGYPDSGANDDKAYRQNYSLPSSSSLKKTSSHDNTDVQPKSLDSISDKSLDKISNNNAYSKTYPLATNQWTEPLNHSRLLYKDFFLRKEGHIALPPQNSPINSKAPDVSDTSRVDTVIKTDHNNDESEYPSYLLNSSTKAYTSKVIEDYKKELQAINNLHELTLKDINTDAISPTPLNIDKMFEINSTAFDDKDDSNENSQENLNINSVPDKNDKNSLDATKRDIAKVPTKELIQNYLKVKEDYVKDFKSHKTFDRKLSNASSKVEINPYVLKQDWNNRNSKTSGKSPIPVNIRNQTQINMFAARAPLSARIESVQNDKDIDSWMSLSAPSPRILEIDNTDSQNEETNAPDNKSGDVEENKTEIETTLPPPTDKSVEKETPKPKELNSNSTVLDIYSMLKEIESYGDNPVTSVTHAEVVNTEAENKTEDRTSTPKDNFMEIFEFLEKVEQSANDALSVVTSTAPQSIPRLEGLLKLPQTELAQRLVTASLQLEERSCCIALLQESLANHKEQMVNKVSNLEKQSLRSVSRAKQECEEAIRRHQSFIDQLINDKKTLNHRIEQLVDERRALEERWRRSAHSLEERYRLELRNQHDKMAAAQQVARQRWVRQKAEKIKELTVRGLEGELREMAERQQQEVADLRLSHAEQAGRARAAHAAELEQLRRALEEEREAALVKERQLASSRLEKQILELEARHQEQRTRLVGELRADNERVARGLADTERAQRDQIEQWRQEQEQAVAERRAELERELARGAEHLQEQMRQKESELEQKLEEYKRELEAEQQAAVRRKATEIAAQLKAERDREIEKAIESMEAEAQAGREELQEALRRNKSEYESELEALAESERAARRRGRDALDRLRAAEDRCAELEVSVGQLETRNKVLTEKNGQLESEVEEVRGRCEEAGRRAGEALAGELRDARRTHHEQMHQLYAKVKVAVARKDAALQARARELAKLQEKVAGLEQRLQQQRKDFLRQK